MHGQLTSCVKTKQGLTEIFTCEIGTRQGYLLSPFLFKLFISDLIELLNQNEIGVYINENVTNLSCLVYADDVADGADTVLRLQRQIDTISRFCDCTGLKLNIFKTKIVVFRRGGIVKENEKWFYKR